MRQVLDQLIGLVIKAFVAVLYGFSQFRLKRKVYTSRKERISDLILGVVAFPVTNGLALLFLMMVADWLSDNEASRQLIMSGVWVVNIAFFILSLILRPYIGIGYATGFVIVSMLPIIAGIFVVGGCFVIFIFFAIVGIIGKLAQSPDALMLIVLCLGGLALLGSVIFIVIWRWHK